MIMKKFLSLLLFFTCATTAFAVASSPQKLTVMLDSMPNPNHAPLVIAQQQGFFKEQGLDVVLLNPSDSHGSLKAVASGKIDIGVSYEPTFLKQIDQGWALTTFGTLIDKPLDCIVALKNSQIRSPLDLKGKRIGIKQDKLSLILLTSLLKKQGINIKEVNIIPLRHHLMQALLSHQVDAVIGLMRNIDVPQLESKKQGILVFFPEEHGIPNYSQLVFITKTANSHDSRFPGFLAAIQKAVAYLDEHPQQTWHQFIKQYPQANNRVNQAAWFVTIPYFAEEPANVDREEWKQFAQFMQDHRLIKVAQPVTHYAIAFNIADKINA